MRSSERTLAALLTCVTMLVAVPLLFAQVTSDTAVPRSSSGDAPVRVLPRPAALYPGPHRHTTVPAKPQVEKESKLGKVAHLQRAAEHLKAAGRLELANRVAKEAHLEAKLAKIQELQAEVKRLRGETASHENVTLDVRVMELQVSKMKKLGFDFHSIDGIGYGQITGDAPVALPAINEFIAALQKHDLIKVLAEPTLVTVSGRPASFQSGGEFPIIVPQSAGHVSVEYRQFGTRLDCLANVLDNGRIRLELRPSVSEIDATRSVTVGDTTIPGLRTRWLDMAVEIQDGQTWVLGGLKQPNSGAIGDSAASQETSLIVVVTAKLGAPVQQATLKVEEVRR